MNLPEVRNGRLAIDWFSRALRPRGGMLRLDGQWYDRAALREHVAQAAAAKLQPAVPASRRPLTAAELAAVQNDNPWSPAKLYAP